MRRIAEVLKQVSDGLDLPQPTKSRILLEMAGDLEDLYQHHLSQGFDEAAAASTGERANSLAIPAVAVALEIQAVR